MRGHERVRRRRGRGGGAVRANGSVPRARARLLCGSSPPLRPRRSAPVPRSSRAHGARSDPARARVPCARGAPAFFFFLVSVHQTAHAPAPSPAALRAHLGPRQGSSPRGRSAPRAPRRRRRALSFPSHRKKKKRKKRCERARNQIKSQRGRRTSDRSFQRRVAHVTRLGECLPHGRSVLLTLTLTSSSCTACMCRARTKVRQSDGATANQTRQNMAQVPEFDPIGARARAPFGSSDSSPLDHSTASIFCLGRLRRRASVPHARVIRGHPWRGAAPPIRVR